MSNNHHTSPSSSAMNNTGNLHYLNMPQDHIGPSNYILSENNEYTS